ncbi:MAG: putative beta-lysine N-acetyltransferase [Marinilabiliaceae bacterium]|nr:putative beta-lysine N-acetyltransferase [Marinilabiliaceae bacterium]
MDKTEKIGQSLIQHGKDSNRIYLMKLHPSDAASIISVLFDLAHKNGYTKIFAKIPSTYYPLFLSAGFQIEASIPGFYDGNEDGLFLGYYLDASRKLIKNKYLKTLGELLTSEANPIDQQKLDQYSFRILNEKDIEQMIAVFRQVFASYPFPIFDPHYLKETMEDGVIYFGAFTDERLTGISSAETDASSLNAEMTDFAVLHEARGKRLALHLLNQMEQHLKNSSYKTLYTIARLHSPSMNKTFMNMRYKFAGTLINNTQISGGIESMNIWYKNI